MAARPSFFMRRLPWVMQASLAARDATQCQQADAWRRVVPRANGSAAEGGVDHLHLKPERLAGQPRVLVLGVEGADQAALLVLLPAGYVGDEGAAGVLDGGRERILVGAALAGPHHARRIDVGVSFLAAPHRGFGDVVVGEDPRPAGHLRVPDPL